MAFEIVKWTGAAYLVVLGSWTIWRAGKDVPDEKPRVLNHPYVQALLTQLGNPKTVLFFGALLPQFLDVNRPLWPQYLIMWAIVAAGTVTWWRDAPSGFEALPTRVVAG